MIVIRWAASVVGYSCDYAINHAGSNVAIKLISVSVTLNFLINVFSS